MLTAHTPPTLRQRIAARLAAYRRPIHVGLGTLGLGYAAILLYPKVLALTAGNLDVLGVGAIANLGLVFGSLMFLREAQRERSAPAPRADSAT